MATEYEYTVTLRGDKEKLKWAEDIIAVAVRDAALDLRAFLLRDISKMGDFLLKHSILVPEDYLDLNCNTLGLLAILFCEEYFREVFVYDSFHDFMISCILKGHCGLKEDYGLEIICKIDSCDDAEDFFDSLVRCSDYLSSYDIQHGRKENNSGDLQALNLW